MSQRVMVIFKKDVSQETIDKQASLVEQNGGRLVRKFDDTGILKGFSAEIPDGFLTMLQSSLKGSDSPINYIEPDGKVTTQ